MRSSVLARMHPVTRLPVLFPSLYALPSPFPGALLASTFQWEHCPFVGREGRTVAAEEWTRERPTIFEWSGSTSTSESERARAEMETRTRTGKG